MMHLEILGYPVFTLAPQPQSFSKPTRPIFSAGALEVPVAIQEVRSPGPRLL